MLFKWVALTGLVVSGCATTALQTEHAGELGSHARVVLAPLRADETLRVVPHAIEPMLPSADHIARVIEMRIGPEAEVDVRYCVSPAGRVVSAELSRGSSFAPFDRAVMQDIVTWRFAAQPGPTSLKTCQAATIIYRPRA
jgi:TonB family protein